MSGLLDTAWSLTRDAAAAARSAAAGAIDADRLLMRSTAALIEVAASRYALDRSEVWRPGVPLRLLFVGYAGTRNTGADVRVEEMIRQFRHLLGDEHCDLSIFTVDPALTRGYFKTVKQLELPKLFPKCLFESVGRVHGAVACEGSMFKSKFANALSTLMAGGLGLAAAEQKLAIGYGGEAGKMDAPLEAFVRRYCREALIIARNQESVELLGSLGIGAHPGTDTAWTFDPAPREVGARLLREKGWDGRRPILALCPINPFWWPVRADVGKRVAHALTGVYSDAHYKSVYFHTTGPEVSARQTAYLTAIAQATRRLRRRDIDPFVILVGMEQLDRRACEALDDLLGGDNALVISDEHDMFEMVSMIRHATALVSSRYHAIVTSMPGGVASAGITMDERIRNLMKDRGQPELALEVDDPELAERLYPTLQRLFDPGASAAIRRGIEGCVVKNLERMGHMGMLLVDYVRARHPAFPFREGLGVASGAPWAHLPGLPPEIEALVDRVGVGS